MSGDTNSVEITQRSTCLIVGAGLTGLTAARHLASTGSLVTMVDKAKSPGGRLATRRLGKSHIDHGAQFFTVRSERFAAEVETWIDDGIVDEWCRGFGTEDGFPRYRAKGGMNSIARHLAVRLQSDLLRPPTLATRAEASAIIPGPDAWSVVYQGGGREPDEVDAVITTAPVPQSVKLLRSGGLGSPLIDDLEDVDYNRVIAILASLDRSPGLPEPGALQQPENGVFTFVADSQAKSISSFPAMTFHCSHSLSHRLWSLDDGDVLVHLHEDLRSYLGPALVEEVQVKRWRYAGPMEPYPEPCAVVAEQPGPLVVAGDGFGSSKVEGAFLSGLAAAEAVLSRH